MIRLGDVVSRRDVEVSAFNRFRTLRDAILKVPNQLAVPEGLSPAICWSWNSEHPQRNSPTASWVDPLF
jgi:hypothetical protein